VIFFNNTGYLGMCGHGTIGLIASLHYQGLIAPGVHKIDTPVGPVSATLHEDGAVTWAMCRLPLPPAGGGGRARLRRVSR
jgi:proline racemase